MPMSFSNVQSSGSSAGAGSLPVPDAIDEEDSQYFYFGWEDFNGSWAIQRQSRSTGFSEAGSGAYPDLATAWANRATLGY